LRNPRALFPIRDDFIRSAWVQRARSKRAQEYEDLYPYFSSTAHHDVTSASTDVSTSPALKNARGTSISQRPSSVQSNIKAGQVNDNNAGTTLSVVRCQHMGVGVGPDRVVELRRAFRRLEPEKMFRAPRAEGESIWAYWKGAHGDGGGQNKMPRLLGKRASTEEGFVMVPAKELAEVRALEGTLRHERSVLNAHCLLAFKEGEVSAHRPLEVTRMAVHDACGREMADALRKYRAWAVRNRSDSSGDVTVLRHRRNNKIHRTHRSGGEYASQDCSEATVTAGTGKRMREDTSKERVAELQRTPAGWRTLRWLMMRRQDEERSQAAEAAAMFTEEMQQRHKERRVSSDWVSRRPWERRHDYDLYCVLAGQFWPLESQEFRADSRPGKKLFLELDKPARKITKMWRTCWPSRKAGTTSETDRKRRGCLAVQALWRSHRVRRRWRPIVRLRVRHGRRSCLRPCFSSWSKLTRVHKRVRRRFDELQGRWTRSCFEAWAGWTEHQAAEKLGKLERAGRTLRNIAAYRSFRSWQVYTRGARRARTLFARAVGAPTLGAWIRYTSESKKDRQRGDNAVTVQRHVRGYLARRRYRATRAIIRGFDRLISAKGARQLFRKALAAAHRRAADEHLQTVRDFEVGAGLAKEDKRLAKLQKDLRLVNAAVRKVVAKRLKRGWLSTARVVDATRGGGELQREIKAVREEWRALDAERDGPGAMNASGRNTWGRGVSGGGGGGGGVFSSSKVFSGRLNMENLNGLTWGRSGVGGSRSERSTEKGEAAAKDPDELLEKETATLGEGGANIERKIFLATSVSRSAEAAEREARRRILDRDRDLAREIITHNFDVRNPPPLKCCAPRCGCTFTQDEHYLSHWATGGHQSDLRLSSLVPETLVHVGGDNDSAAVSTHLATPTSEMVYTSSNFDPPTTPKGDTAPVEARYPTLGEGDVASFHLVLANGAGWKDEQGVVDNGDAPTGFNLVSAYIARVWGHGQAHSTLLLWNAVNSWRRHLTTDPGYTRDAVAMRGLYLDPGALLEARLPESTRQYLIRVLEALPDLDDATAKGRHGSAVDYVKTGGYDADDNGSDRKEPSGASAPGDHSTGTRESATVDKGSWLGKTATIEHSWQEVFGNRRHGAATFPVASSAAAAAAATAASVATPASLRPTSFDEAQWHALSYLCKSVGPGFWTSDLGRRAALLRSKELKREREAAHESVRLERRSRMANEAAEVRQRLVHEREQKEDLLAEPALDVASDSVIEAVLRSVAAKAELMAMQELEVAREEDMIAEAASVEAVWAVEPPFLEHLIVQEVDAYFRE
ncbi:unnamed protein product, partial [Laminaria digitata]